MPLSSPLHRVPVLWSLYRPLLRLAPSPTLQGYIRRLFRRSLKLRNLDRVKQRLGVGYTMLDELTKVHQGDAYLRAKYQRLEAHIQSLAPPPVTPPPVLPPQRTILTPGIIKATTYNPPLPRLKPQPERITMMLFNRRKTIQRRWNRFEVARARIEEAKEESRFEDRLGLGAVVEGGNAWGEEWVAEIEFLKSCFTKEAKRDSELPSEELRAAALGAHRTQGAYLRVKAAAKSSMNGTT